MIRELGAVLVCRWDGVRESIDAVGIDYMRREPGFADDVHNLGQAGRPGPGTYTKHGAL